MQRVLNNLMGLEADSPSMATGVCGANNVDSYRFASTVFRAVTDNAVTLGNQNSRW